MFRGAFENPQDSWVRRLLDPVLDAADVARSTLDAVERGDPVLVLPWHVGFIAPVLRLLPVALLDLVAGFFGGWHGMDRFRGRAAHAPRKGLGAGGDEDEEEEE
jgi:hypothetical protein